MKSWIKWVLAAVVIAIVGGAGYWFGHHGAAEGADKDDEASIDAKATEPVATVGVLPLRHGQISQPIIAYGTVFAPASEVRVVSVPFECRVSKVMVTPGQTVAAGEPLIEVEGSLATHLAFEEASNAASAAQRDMELVKRRYEQKLATNSDLYAAQNALKTAEARLQNLQQAGTGKPRTLSAEATGIVSKIDVQVGQIVPIGNPLVEVAARNRIEVRLGIEPDNVPFLKPGQSVQLLPIDQSDAQPVTGTIRLIDERVDPTDRLVDVMVSLPADTKLLLEGLVSGTMFRESSTGFVVPRNAVLPDDDGYTIFIVKDNHAVKQRVSVLLENDQQAQVTGDNLHEGDPAVVDGNYELEDGMAVQAHPAAIKPATSEPAAATTEPVEQAPAPGDTKTTTPTGGPR